MFNTKMLHLIANLILDFTPRLHNLRQLTIAAIFAIGSSATIPANPAMAEQCAQIFFASPQNITIPSRLVEHIYREGEYRQGIELLGQELQALSAPQREALSAEIAAHLRRAPKLPTHFVYQKLGPKRAMVRLLSVMNSWSENLSHEAQTHPHRAFENHLQRVLQMMRRGDPELGAYTPTLVRDVIELIAAEYRLTQLNYEVRIGGSFVNGYAHLRTSDLDIIEPLRDLSASDLAHGGSSSQKPAASPLSAQLAGPAFKARLRGVLRRHQIVDPAISMNVENTLMHFAPRAGETPATHADRVSQFVGQISPVQIVIRRQDANVVVELEVHRHEESGEHFVQRFLLN